MKFNSIEYQKLSYLRQFYSDPRTGIPAEGGIYYWVYWPDFDPTKLDGSQLALLLLDYTQRSLFFKEVLRGPYKFEAEIKEQNYPSNGNIFGLSNSKKIKLIKYLDDLSNRILFHQFFKEVCFSRPFYIGKAKNLRIRLASQHFRGTTEVIPEIDNAKISYTDIWVGYKLIPDPNNEDINTIFEEILSRRIKPGLTKKPN